jgi:hypothetical protein
MEKRRPKNGEIMNLKGKNIVKHREIVITREKKADRGRSRVQYKLDSSGLFSGPGGSGISVLPPKPGPL